MIGPLNVEGVRGEGFALEPVLRHNEIALTFSGNGDMEAAPRVGPFLKLLHDELLAHGATDVHVDFSDLHFMNSSCLKAFLWWIDRVRAMGDRGYRIRIRPAAGSHWQRRSLEALRRAAPAHVMVEIPREEGQ